MNFCTYIIINLKVNFNLKLSANLIKCHNKKLWCLRGTCDEIIIYQKEKKFATETILAIFPINF